MSKTVYSFDPSTRAFTAPLLLDQGDLSPLEPGVYLMPGNSLDAMPPTATAGKWPFAVAGSWVLQDLSTSRPGPGQELSLEEHRSRLKDAVAARRRLIETGGITLADGIKVKTGIEDQVRVAQLIQGMEANDHADVLFKTESGRFTFTLAQMNALLKTIAFHVRACFEAERAHHDAIDALGASSVERYDIFANWPSRQA
jgi:hypothetical protein